MYQERCVDLKFAPHSETFGTFVAREKVQKICMMNLRTMIRKPPVIMKKWGNHEKDRQTDRQEKG